MALAINELLLVPVGVVPINHSYLLMLPLPALAATERVALWHMVCAAGCVLMVGKAFIVAVTAVREVDTQPVVVLRLVLPAVIDGVV